MCKVVLPVLLVLLLGFTISFVFAAPPTEEVLQKIIDRGELDNFKALMNQARARGFEQPQTHPKKSPTSLPSAQPQITRTLVILIDYPDKPYTAGLVAATPAMFDSVLFSMGKNPTGSLREYFLQNSFGQLNLQADIVGWFRAAHPSTYYTQNCNGEYGFGVPPNSMDLCQEAIALADPFVDFSLYDNDHDGAVDGFFIIRAGEGAERTSNPCDLWSFASGSGETRDGVYLGGYAFVPEEDYDKIAPYRCFLP